MNGKRKANKKNPKHRSFWILLMWTAIIAVAGSLIYFLSEGGEQHSDQQSEANAEENVEIKEQETIELPSGLVITRIDDYAGIYMEDGSDEIVNDVMMIIVKNATEHDLQLSRIQLEYETLLANFEVTNLPSGASVVLLERNRNVRPNSQPVAIRESDVIFFERPMGIMDDVLEVAARDGVLNVKNISDQDVAGDIYLYYKNSASDLFYGGITYRTKVEGGIAAGEMKQVMTGHFNPDGSVIVSITAGA